MVAILSKQREAILDAVQAMYADVAAHPRRSFHFPTGRDACLFVGYPEAVLEGVPASALESFAGVGFPFEADGIRPGDAVLDVGSGAGTDVLIASARVGRAGRVVGLDMTRAMLDRLERSIAAAQASNVEPLAGNAERIPLPDGSVDVVLSNGVLNLVPDKAAALAEMYRVLRPGARLQLADIVLGRPVSDGAKQDIALWTGCIAGGLPREELAELVGRAGFTNVQILDGTDVFAGAPQHSNAAAYGTLSAGIRARKPA